jgi:hypothetical protein
VPLNGSTKISQSSEIDAGGNIHELLVRASDDMRQARHRRRRNSGQKCLGLTLNIKRRANCWGWERKNLARRWTLNATPLVDRHRGFDIPSARVPCRRRLRNALANFRPASFGWSSIATVATWIMTLFIQRAETRDTLAIHAKLDELLRAETRTRNELTTLDEQRTRRDCASPSQATKPLATVSPLPAALVTKERPPRRARCWR